MILGAEPPNSFEDGLFLSLLVLTALYVLAALVRLAGGRGRRVRSAPEIRARIAAALPALGGLVAPEGKRRRGA